MTTEHQPEAPSRKKPTRQKKKQLSAGSSDRPPLPAGQGNPSNSAAPELAEPQPIGRSSPNLTFQKLPRALRAAFGEKSRFLLWGLPTSLVESNEGKLLEKLQKAIDRDRSSVSLTEEVAQALADSPSVLLDTAGLFVALGATYALAQLTASEGAQPTERIIETVHRLCTPSKSDLEEAPAIWLLTEVELPLVLGLVEHRLDSHRLAELANRFALFVEQNLEEEGWLPQPCSGELAVLHASLLRCQLILRYLGQRLEEKVAHRLEWMTRNLFRLLDQRGQQMLGAGVAGDLPGMARAARRVTTDEEDSRLLKAIESGDFPGPKRLPDCSGYCEETMTAVLRGDWQAKSAKLAIQVVGGKQLVEGGARDTFFRGNWTPEIAFNGETLALQPESAQLNCWNSDYESDYLEFQVELSAGVIWQRQYALDKREQVLFVADVFLGQESGRWEYRCTIPTTPEISLEEATESRELRLQGPKSLVQALPLSMGEWKADRTDDAFVRTEQGIEARQTRRGQACLFASAFDLDHKRAKRPATWRQLTVGEDLNPVPRDQALAFRFQFGHLQWLIYRSFTPLASRTYLGQNVYSEFAFDRFLEDGTAESLVSVE